MLTSLVLEVEAPAGGTLPVTLGRAVRAQFLEWVAARQPSMAQALHDGQGPKPYTVSNLTLGRRDEGGQLSFRKGERGWLRITGLTQEVSELLADLTGDPPAQLTLQRRSLTVGGASLTGHPWAGYTNYQELAAPFLLQAHGQLPETIGLEFVTPTTFSSSGQNVPLPIPRLVFESLFNRWQAFAPIELHPELGRVIAEQVVVNRFDIHSRGVPSKGAVQIGFEGQVTFEMLGRPDWYWLNLLHLLAAFAFYSGVGYQTATGLGQARPVDGRQ